MKDRVRNDRLSVVEQVFFSKVGSFEKLIARNSDMNSNLQVRTIDIEATEKLYKERGFQGFDSIQETISREYKSLKRRLKVDDIEDYEIAKEEDSKLERTEYIYWLDKTLNDFKEYKPTPEKDEELEALRLEYKELTGENPRNKGKDSLRKTIEEYK